MIEINKSKLDLRFEGKLDSETSLLFNTISNEKRSGFNNFIAELSEPNIGNVDWWLEGPASRNTLSSPLFHRYCCLFLVLNLIENNKFKVYSEGNTKFFWHVYGKRQNINVEPYKREYKLMGEGPYKYLQKYF